MGATEIDVTETEERDMLDREVGPRAAEGRGPEREANPEELEREVEEIRENISGIVGELDRRGHELFDWQLQLRKHAVLIAAVGTSCLVGFGLTVAVGTVRRRRRSRPLAKARRLREALTRMIDHPERVALPRPGVGKRAAAAVVSGIVGALTRTLARRILEAAEPEEPAFLAARPD